MAPCGGGKGKGGHGLCRALFGAGLEVGVGQRLLPPRPKRKAGSRCWAEVASSQPKQRLVHL